MKKNILMMLIFLICGMVSANICLNQLKDSSILLEMEVYKEYANAKLVFRDVFWNVLYERVKLLIFLVLLCFTPIRKKLSVVLISVFSFIWGFFLMSCICGLGIVGLVVGLCSAIPHGLLYGGALFLFIQKRNTRNYLVKENVVQNIVVYIFIALLFISGCVVESLMGTHFIPWVIRLSLI